MAEIDKAFAGSMRCSSPIGLPAMPRHTAC